MKKLIFLVTAMILFCSKIFAEKSQMDSLGKSGIDAFGTCINNKTYQEIRLNIPGMNTIKLNSENTVVGGSSDSSEDDNLRVIIIPLNESEGEAYKWFLDSSIKLGVEVKGYYLAFYRYNTPALPKGKVTISLSVQKDNTNLKIYYMNENAQYNELNYKEKENRIVFPMAQSGYYVVSKSEITSESLSNSNESESISAGNIIESLKTGDNFSDFGLYTLMFLISGGAFTLTNIKRKNSTKK